MSQKSLRRHLLVIGAPRSGTTLLAAMIGRHDQVGLLVEAKRPSFVDIAGKAVVGNKLCVPNQIEFEDNWENRVSHFSKAPLEKYLALPHFKAVMIVRHANPVIASIMKRAGKPFEEASFYWRRGIEIMHALQQRLGPAAVVISFENLLVEPARHMRRVAALLELPYQEKMLEGHQYNPYYREFSGLDSSRARAEKLYQFPVDLERAYPEVWARYLALNRCSE